MKKGVISILSTLAGAAAGAATAGIAVGNLKGKEIDKQARRANKNASVIDALARWVSIMQDGKSVKDFFVENNYKTVAIYGYHYIGERLFEELRKNGIEVKYAIDQNRSGLQADIEVKKLEDDLEEVDAVIVTPVFYFNEIEDKLVEIFDCPIISFEEVLSETEQM